MGWASKHIEQLQQGQEVKFRPSGHSMTGIVNDKDLCTVTPCKVEDCATGDVVLCKVGGKEYLHKVVAVGSDGRLQIGNNKGHINGWTRSVYGKCIKVEP